jgi:Ca2+-transporting ATPase
VIKHPALSTVFYRQDKRTYMKTFNIDPKMSHTLSGHDVLDGLNTSSNGLSSGEANQRLEYFGANRINRKSSDTALKLLWQQINNPLIWVLLGSCTLAMTLGKMTDGLVVLAVVVVNTIIGFIQEYKAGKAIAALSDMVPQNAAVIRNGVQVTIPVVEIVPGDVVMLAAGDRVPADMRIIAHKNLTIEEAALTGESLPAQKNTDPVAVDAVLGDRQCMAFGGTLVTTGTATAVVVGTGMNTELGKISTLLNSAANLETPLTLKLAEVGKFLTIGVIAITAVMLVIGVIRATANDILLTTALKDGLIFAIALAVGAIPEGLPAVVTIALAIGVQRMAARHAIIRKLPAVETLGSTTIICSDKTGTLTRNEMTVTELWTPLNRIEVTGAGYNRSGAFALNGQPVTELPHDTLELITDALLCNDASIQPRDEAYEVTGDPTEIALVVAAAKAGINTDTYRTDHPRLDVIPFDSELQIMATLNDVRKPVIILKGAPEVVVKRCFTGMIGTAPDPHLIVNQVERMGALGMRVLAVACKEAELLRGDELGLNDVADGFTFVGLVGMIDPPRVEAMEAIKACHRAGIVVKMITGDHRATARAIGRELGLSDKGEVITGVELSKMSDEELQKAALEVNIFARVAPEHKLKLVKALQTQGHIIAMTGDGVNDAPSLKQANIGVAMGITGTSVSKEAADIVLADDNFSSIGAAVEEGRRVYDNLLKSLAFLLPTNLGLAFILIYGILFFPFNPLTHELLLPMLPVQLLWINLVAAVTLALPLAFEVKEPNAMSRPPRSAKEPLFNRFMTMRVVLVSLIMLAGTIFVFKYQYDNALTLGMLPKEALPGAQTMAVTFVVVFQIFYMLNCRSLKDSVAKIGFFSNRYVFVGVGAIIVFQSIFIYSPFMQRVFSTTSLSAIEVVWVLLAGALIFPLISIEKWILKRWER